MKNDQNEMQCCIIECNNNLDKNYWDIQYKNNANAWDIGFVSNPIKNIIDNISNKNLKILIPGCGNAYEAEYLLLNGFTNITVIDISTILINNLKLKFKNNNNIKILEEDFFEHNDNYDIIIEQTFFCALSPILRQKYVYKTFQLLNKNGKTTGLLFNKNFEKNGPPFGGTKEEYLKLFNNAFVINKLENCNNSINKRIGDELIFEFIKDENYFVNIYNLEGITCVKCANTISLKFLELKEIKNISINTNFTQILIISENIIPLEKLESILKYDKKNKITN